VPPLHEADSGVQGETNTIHDTFWMLKNQDDQRGFSDGRRYFLRRAKEID
jgi:hypothetical protein